MGEAVFYGATLGVSLEASAAKKAAKCAGGVVFDVSLQLGINSLVKIYLGQPHEFSDLIKEVSIPSAVTSCATAAFVEKCSGKCAGLAGFAAGAGDDILKQLSNGKKLSEVKIKPAAIKGLIQGIIAYGTQNIINFASKTWTKYNTKQLADALKDAESNPGKYFGESGSAGSITFSNLEDVAKLFDKANPINNIKINGKVFKEVTGVVNEKTVKMFEGVTDVEIQAFAENLAGKPLEEVFIGKVWTETTVDGTKINLRNVSSSSEATGTKWTIELPNSSILKDTKGKPIALEIKFR
ncbi:MAG: hypothetical protein WBP45_03220 [Daejeonella sp.]